MGFRVYWGGKGAVVDARPYLVEVRREGPFKGSIGVLETFRVFRVLEDNGT